MSILYVLTCFVICSFLLFHTLPALLKSSDIYEIMTEIFILLAIITMVTYFVREPPFTFYDDLTRDVVITEENGAVGIAGEWHHDYTDGKTL